MRKDAEATVLDGLWREAYLNKDHSCEGLEDYWREMFSRESAKMPCRSDGSVKELEKQKCNTVINI